MRFEPHEYQCRAMRWIMDHPRCLLFLEMGLGKTTICLTAVETLRRYGEAERVLVIAPRTVAESTWSDEAEKWDHLTLRVSNVIGTEKQRERALQEDADVYVIGRDSTVWLCEHYNYKLPYDMVIIDELTSFKNPRALRFKALKRSIKGMPRVVGLTGTPTPNGLLDLWAQVYCIDNGDRLGKYITHYRDQWFDYTMRNNIIVFIRPKKGAQEEIMDAISDIALSMRSEDWLQMPPLVTETVPVKLPEVTMKRYRAFERDKVLELTKGGEALTADSAASLVNKLAQFANGAIYAEDGSFADSAKEQRRYIEIHDRKLVALEEIFFSEDHTQSPLLVFYQYKHDCDRIIRHFEKLKKEGKVSGLISKYSGWRDLRDWNNGVVCLLLAHPASTAYGLNMQQGGHRIAWFSTGWNLEQYQQATARLYRQGQTHTVRVFNIVAKGTVDEKMARALDTKGTDQRDVMKILADEIIHDVRKE
ncbi:MAG: DEAD/DEAH box helicase [Muribaculaceae bacterium]|nr:DEAD/DEAH box helicase [Muribaculaceae bacterium]